jgi:hypothetical protein
MAVLRLLTSKNPAEKFFSRQQNIVAHRAPPNLSYTSRRENPRILRISPYTESDKSGAKKFSRTP